ncbi:MAG: PIG-L family deacetylase [Pseudomonadaceae bacterium]|nr:PIG-L family deacetylase [Pseudomonadaceae bacterium]
MSARKQQLLKQHRRHKRIALLIGLTLLLLLGIFVVWWLLPLLLVLGWIVHEAWFADHLFYAPGDDYQYSFPDGTPAVAVRIVGGQLQLQDELGDADTLILQLELRSTWLGRWLDPYVLISAPEGADRQDFERGVGGQRYLNLSGQLAALKAGQLSLSGRFCRLPLSAILHVFSQPDYRQQRLLVIAPHADDAELAAFGLYSQAAAVSIVTLTQGEIEAENYQLLGLGQAQAARLKGRLRSWDSLAIPLWGGVPQSQCVQLGYYCLQLPAMLDQPEQVFGSRESGEGDICSVRLHNPLRLPGDVDGRPSGANLHADLVALLEHFRPEVVVTPHPELDPHSDHVAATRALLEAIQVSTWQPHILLLYANHLHDNDRWPMGPAGNGIALPPAITALPADSLWSPCLSAEQQLDKAMALQMQHDLHGSLAFKKRLRRLIQQLLLGRRWPATGDNEFMRKAVRRHELFWVRHL